MAGRCAFLNPCYHLLALLAFATAVPNPGNAEVRIAEAGADRLVVEAHDATVRQVLDALAGKRVINIRSSDPLSQSVSGTYSGSILGVLARILERYDHVVETTGAGIRISILGPRGAAKPLSPDVRNAAPIPNHRVSTNIDLDEEEAQSAGARTKAQR